MEHLLSSSLNGNLTTQGEELGTQITPQGWNFWTMIFYNILSKFSKALIHHYSNSVVELAKDYYIDGQNTQQIFFEKMSTWGGKQGPQITPRWLIFGP